MKRIFTIKDIETFLKQHNILWNSESYENSVEKNNNQEDSDENNRYYFSDPNTIWLYGDIIYQYVKDLHSKIEVINQQQKDLHSTVDIDINLTTFTIYDNYFETVIDLSCDWIKFLMSKYPQIKPEIKKDITALENELKRTAEREIAKHNKQISEIKSELDNNLKIIEEITAQLYSSDQPN